MIPFCSVRSFIDLFIACANFTYMCIKWWWWWWYQAANALATTSPSASASASERRDDSGVHADDGGSKFGGSDDAEENNASSDESELQFPPPPPLQRQMKDRSRPKKSKKKRKRTELDSDVESDESMEIMGSSRVGSRTKRTAARDFDESTRAPLNMVPPPPNFHKVPIRRLAELPLATIAQLDIIDRYLVHLYTKFSTIHGDKSNGIRQAVLARNIADNNNTKFSKYYLDPFRARDIVIKVMRKYRPHHKLTWVTSGNVIHSDPINMERYINHENLWDEFDKMARRDGCSRSGDVPRPTKEERRTKPRITPLDSMFRQASRQVIVEHSKGSCTPDMCDKMPIAAKAKYMIQHDLFERCRQIIIDIDSHKNPSYASNVRTVATDPAPKKKRREEEKKKKKGSSGINAYDSERMQRRQRKDNDENCSIGDRSESFLVSDEDEDSDFHNDFSEFHNIERDSE